jgi:hypothetical protein
VLRQKGIKCSKHCPTNGTEEILELCEDRVPGPPNLVSLVLLEGELSAAELKCLLLDAVRCTKNIDPRIAPLVGSSMSYNNPELTPWEILVYTAVMTLIIICLIKSI